MSTSLTGEDQVKISKIGPSLVSELTRIVEQIVRCLFIRLLLGWWARVGQGQGDLL